MGVSTTEMPASVRWGRGEAGDGAEAVGDGKDSAVRRSGRKEDKSVGESIVDGNKNGVFPNLLG